MIVSCPSCAARYKINEAKIKGRGAKITCPRCSHRFVVYRDKTADPKKEKKRRIPDDVSRLDFRTLGITWRVRKGIGVTYDFHDLATLQDFLRDGQVEKWDSVTYDNRKWTPIEAIEDIEAYFYDVWQRARRGEISVAAPEEDDYAEDEEDDSDAPTTIVGRGSSLASEIRQALSERTPVPRGLRLGRPRTGKPTESVADPESERDPPSLSEEIFNIQEDEDEQPLPEFRSNGGADDGAPALFQPSPAPAEPRAPSAAPNAPQTPPYSEPDPAPAPAPAPPPRNEPQPTPLPAPPPAPEPAPAAPAAPSAVDEPEPPAPPAQNNTVVMMAVGAVVILVLLIGGLILSGALSGGSISPDLVPAHTIEPLP